MTALNILNSVLIIYLLLKQHNRFYLSIHKETTFYNKTLLAYNITLWKRQKNGYGHNGICTLSIPMVINRNKVVLSDEVQRLISDSTNRSYNLRTKFSWLKTWEEVRKFERDYKTVDLKLVEKLVAGFVPK